MVKDDKEFRFYSVCQMYGKKKEREDSFLFGKSIPVAFGVIFTKWQERTIDEELETEGTDIIQLVKKAEAKAGSPDCVRPSS